MVGAIYSVIFFVAFCGLQQSTATVVNEGKPIFCTRASITAVRIQGCAREPCALKKGLPIEIDFSFQKPSAAEELGFSVTIPWGGFGTDLARGNSCSQAGVRQCPARAGQRHTLKSSLYAPPSLKAGSGKSTGKATTSWMLTPNDRNIRGAYSQCSFNVDLNIQ